MASLLEGKIARQVAAGFKGRLLRGTGYRAASATTTNGDGDPVAVSFVPYKVEGSVDTYSAYTQATLGIPDTDVRILLIAGLCSREPLPGDKLFLRREWWVLGRCEVDPATATFTFRGSPTTPVVA